MTVRFAPKKNLRGKLRFDVFKILTGKVTLRCLFRVSPGQKVTQLRTETYAPGSAETYVFSLFFTEGERK